MLDWPGCQEAAAPKRRPYQLLLARASPSSYQTVLRTPVECWRWPSATNCWMLLRASLLLGQTRGPVVDAGGDPGFDAGLGEGRDVACEALGGVGVYHQATAMVFCLKDCGRDLRRSGLPGLGDVAPEEDFAVEGGEGGVDFLEEVEVDGAEAAGVDVGFGLAEAEVDGFVGADVEEGAGVVGGELGEHLTDVAERAGLAGSEDGAVGGFGEGAVLLPEEVVVEVAEGFLVGDDGDVIAGGVGGELAGLGGRDAAAGRRGERIRGVLLGLFEVRASRR